MPASVDASKIKHLDSQIREVQKQLRDLGDENGAANAELFRIIHNPGWTTILDVALATSHVEVIQAQLKALNSMMLTLQQGAKNALQQTGAAGGH
jgi:prefoldin subunit 5